MKTIVPQQVQEFTAVSQTSSLLVRVYGDSQSMPRASDGVRLRDNYTEQLCDRLNQTRPTCVLNRGKGGPTISELYSMFLRDQIEFAPVADSPETQVIVIQCGLADCSPRPIPLGLRRVISRLPGPIRGRIAGFLHNHRAAILNAGIVFRHTPPQKFRQVLTNWIAQAAPAAIAVTNIVQPVRAIDEHSPGVARSVAHYNSIISEVVANSGRAELADLNVAAEFVSSDGYHATAKGNAVYADVIAAAIMRAVSPIRPNAPLRSGPVTA